MAKTSEGFSISVFEQDGSLAGEELGRVFVHRRYGYDWYALGSVTKARRVVRELDGKSYKQVTAVLNEACADLNGDDRKEN